MELRYYQQEAITALYSHLEKEKTNPVIELPTGAGKTPVLASVCRDTASWGGRVLVVASSKELLDQADRTLRSWYPDLDVGVYSASLKRKESDNQIIVAGIQSIYKRGLELCGTKPFNLVIVDEAHEIPIDGEGMYQRLLGDIEKANPKVRICGLTASPFRTGDGYVCRDNHFLNEICYSVGIKELIAGGYLCRLTSKRSATDIDISTVKVQRGEFVLKDLEKAFDQEAIVDSAVEEILVLTQKRKSVLIFCCGIEHAEHVVDKLSDHTAGIVHSNIPDAERDETIKAFKDGRIKYLVNVNVLTTGFDATNIDCVVLLRSTVSPGLYYQMCGRGLRKHDGKDDCLILDFGGNIYRHGPIDKLQVKGSAGKGGQGEAPVKTCPECREVILASYGRCPECDYEFSEAEPKHEDQASEMEVIGDTETQWEVTDVRYYVHMKRDAAEDDPKTMRVTYMAGMTHICDEYVCFEHTGFAWEKARMWWKARTDKEMPSTTAEAVEIAKSNSLKEPVTVWTIPDNGWKRIKRLEMGLAVEKTRNPGEDDDDDFFNEDAFGPKEECPF